MMKVLVLLGGGRLRSHKVELASGSLSFELLLLISIQSYSLGLSQVVKGFARSQLSGSWSLEGISGSGSVVVALFELLGEESFGVDPGGAA